MDYLFIDNLPLDQQLEFTLWLGCSVVESEGRKMALIQDYRQWIFKIKGL